MPQSAIDTGVVDLTLQIDQIPAALERFANLPDRAQLAPEQVAQEERPELLTSLDEDDLRRLAALLEAQLGFDLRVYKPATVERRVLRRPALSGFDDVDTYVEHLREAPSEQQTLVRDLLISVTEFFRDPAAFAALRTTVIEPLVAQAEPGATLRAWVPGCATGEEAYAIGMEFLDAIQHQNKRVAVQIFATDIDQDALAVARAATYPASIVEHVSEQRIKHYFKPLNGKGYQARSFLRDIVSFAVHDLTKDPPFSRIHLVSCRNVLIYLTSEAQKHVLKVLHFALEPQGYLFLGTSETTGPRRQLFSTISKSQRLTPAARELLGIDHADTGRAVGDIARELLQQDLQGESRAVLEDFSVRSRELRTRDGRWISRQVLPYRTENRHIEGVVVTFVDVTELKSATERLALRERQQSIIAQLGLLALREADIQDFFDRVVGELQRALDADFAKIVELQPRQSELLLRAGVGWEQGRVGVSVEPSGAGSPAGYALQSQAPVVIDDVSAEKRFAIPALLEAHGVTSGISCAIRDGDHRYGVLGAYTKSRRRFTTEDEHFLQAVANVVGSAIGRHQNRTRLALELAVAQVLADASDLDETLALLLERMARTMGSVLVAELWWFMGDKLTRRQLHVAPHSDRRRVEHDFSPAFRAPGEGVVGRVYEEQHALWLTELANAEVFMRSEGAKALGLLSGLALPIRAGNERLGVITLFSRKRMLVGVDHLHSLEAIGRAIGDFIARWRADDSTRQLAAITASSQDAILSYRLDGTVIEWLAGAEQLFGYAPEEIVGQPILRIVPEDRQEELWALTERVGRGEQTDPLETVRVHKDGSLLQVSVRSAPVKSHRDKIIGVSSIDRDIGHLKETERQLREANRQKDEFIAMLGHELRNPLAAIRTASELMEAKSGDVEAIARAQPIIRRQTAHMAKLLEGLLDVSRISRGKIELEKKTVDLAAVCREVCSDYIEQLVNQSSPEIHTDLPSDPLWVEGDPVRLRQVVDNLLSNAVKYTDRGGSVHVVLSRDDGTARLAVRDTGAGIEPELLPYVFEVFRQSGQNLARSQGGLGLGLAITKLLVELHDGSVEASSDGPGKGAEFAVKLPVSKRKGASTPAATNGDGRSLRLLIIDDNEDAANVLKEVLELHGHEVLVAFDGYRGITMAKEQKPDVVLCDLGLPDLDGYGVARALRKEPGLKDTRLVSISGYGRPEDQERGDDAGFHAHLTKPVSIDHLVSAIAEVRARAPDE